MSLWLSITQLLRADAAPPKEVRVTHGCLEVVTYANAYRAGWNEGTLDVRYAKDYGLFHRGKPLVIPENTKHKRFNSIVLFEGSNVGVVVNGEAPDGTYAYYLVRCQGGAPQIDMLGATKKSAVEAEWLTPHVAGSKPVAADAGGKTADPQIQAGRNKLLIGGEWLLDVRTLERFPVPQSYAFSRDHSVPLLGLSPDETAFLAFGMLQADKAMPPRPGIGMFDVHGGVVYGTPIDRRKMRYAAMSEITAAWVHHHFEWRREAGKPTLLAERPAYKPLPYHGVFQTFQTTPPQVQYSVPDVSPELRAQLMAALKTALRASVLDERTPHDGGGVVKMQLDGSVFEVSWPSPSSPQTITVYSIAGDGNVVRRVGEWCDRLLASGKYDSLFRW